MYSTIMISQTMLIQVLLQAMGSYVICQQYSIAIVSRYSSIIIPCQDQYGGRLPVSYARIINTGLVSYAKINQVGHATMLMHAHTGCILQR